MAGRKGGLLRLDPARGAPPLGPSGHAPVLAEVESPHQILSVRNDAAWAAALGTGLIALHRRQAT